MRLLTALVPVCLLLFGGSARADRGALSVELGGGASASAVAAPYSEGSPSVIGSAFNIRAGMRYALSNRFELVADGFYEPGETYNHNGVSVSTPGNGSFPGAESEVFTRFGALAGLHYVRGDLFRLHVGLEVGWCRRLDSSLVSYGFDDQGRFNNDLILNSLVRDNLMIAPSLGVEWAFADHWSLFVAPRIEILVGGGARPSFTLPLLLSYSWYL